MPRVFFDGACPLCAREIEFYQKQEGASRIAWVDGAAAFVMRGRGFESRRPIALSQPLSFDF